MTADGEPDHVYFGRRAQEERKAAQLAASKWDRENHLALAERFDELAAAILAYRKRLGPDL